MAGKKIGDVGEDAILVGGLVAGYFLVVRPILSEFGLDSDTQNLLNTQATKPPTVNAFSFQFAYSWYSQNPAIFSQNYWLQMAEAYSNLSDQSTLTGTSIDVAINAEAIKSAFGWVYVSSDNVVSIFSAINYQADVSNIACYLYFVYNIDLYTLLQKGNSPIPLTVGLYGSTLASIVARVNGLPVSAS